MRHLQERTMSLEAQVRMLQAQLQGDSSRDDLKNVMENHDVIGLCMGEVMMVEVMFVNGRNR